MGSFSKSLKYETYFSVGNFIYTVIKKLTFINHSIWYEIQKLTNKPFKSLTLYYWDIWLNCVLLGLFPSIFSMNFKS